MPQVSRELERAASTVDPPIASACGRELQRALTAAMREHRSPDQLLRMFSQELSRALPHHHVDIVLLTPDKQRFFYLGAAFRNPPYLLSDQPGTTASMWNGLLWNGFETGTSYSLAAYTIRHTIEGAQALRFDDYVSDGRVLETNNPFERRTFESGLAHGLMLPLADDGEVVGGMCCGRGKPHGPFSDREFALANEIATSIAPVVRVFREYRFEHEMRVQLERERDFAERINTFARSVAGTDDAHEILTAFACEVLEPQQGTPWHHVAVRLLDDATAPVVRTFVSVGNGGWRHAGQQPIATAPDRSVLLGERPRLVSRDPDTQHVVITVALRGHRGIVGSLSLSGSEALTTATGFDVAQRLADNLAPFLDAAQLARTVRRPSRAIAGGGADLAQELHDAIVRDLLAAQRALREEIPGTDRSMVRARDLLRGLPAQALSAGELAATLEADARATAEALDATCECDIDLGDETIDTRQAAALLAVGKQLLANARRHSRASAIELELRVVDDHCRLRVGDDGVGMTPGAREYRDAVDAGTVGLFLVRERMRMAGGECRILSLPNQGTVVEITVPTRAPAPSSPTTFVAAEPLVVHPRDLDQLTTLIIDHQQVMREGLRRVLSRTSEFAVVGEAADGATGARIAHAVRPDAIIIDLQVPHRSGADVIREVLEHAPATRILATSALDDPAIAQSALAAGADAFVAKSASADELIRTLRVICSQQSAGRDGAAPRVYVRPRTADAHDAPRLTARETEILKLITTDLTYREIGSRLFISEKTVQYHIGHVFTKLGVRSRAAAVSRAAELGLL